MLYTYNVQKNLEGDSIPQNTILKTKALAPIEVKSPEQKKQTFPVLEKRPREALSGTLETLLFLRGLVTESGK
jgi:hypothetical protein